MIHLSDLQPVPLVSLGLNPQSSVFATECSFQKGCRYIVSAPSGRGKSTLLHCMYGLRSDYTGTITIDGRDVSGFTPDDWALVRQNDLAIVFQDLRLFPQLTAWENIQLHAALNPVIDESRLRRLAHELHIEELLDDPVKQLSYGQRQRVAIVRALSRPFRMILLDEPFSHLDPLNTEIALRLITETCDELEAGMVLVSLGEEYEMEIDYQFKV